MFHITGITGLDRTDTEGRDAKQELFIRDRPDRIHLSLMHSSYGAALTSAQARELSVQLHLAADRLDARNVEKETANV